MLQGTHPIYDPLSHPGNLAATLACSEAEQQPTAQETVYLEGQPLRKQ